MTAIARMDWNGQRTNPVDDSYNWDPTDYGSKDQIVGVENLPVHRDDRDR